MKFILNESQYNGLEEARKNPATNQDPTLREFIEKIMKIAPLEDIYLSFRRTVDVTDVNPNNEFNTPTGFYCYPLSAYDFSENLDNEEKFRNLFPYASSNPLIHFIVLKTDKGVLDAKTPKRVINEYVRKIKALYKSIKPVVNLCDLFLANRYSSKYTTPSHQTHLFWLFLYEIATYLTDGGNMKRRVTRINLLCREIGVNGFVDKKGDGFIHEAEPKQAVFFKLKGIANVYIYKTPKFLTKAVNLETIKKVPCVWPGCKLVVVNNSGNFLYNIIDENNKFISPSWFEKFSTFTINDVTYYVIKRRIKNNSQTSSEKLNILDRSGKLRLSKWIDYVNTIDFMRRPVARVINNGMEAIINENLNFVMDFIYTAVLAIGHSVEEKREATKRMIVGNKDRKYNLIDFTGKEMSKKWFDDMTYWYVDDMIRVSDNKRYNWITPSGKLISEIWFDSTDISFRPYCWVRNKNGFNFIDRNGKLVREKWFTSIRGASDDYDNMVYDAYDNDVLVGRAKPYQSFQFVDNK